MDKETDKSIIKNKNGSSSIAQTIKNKLTKKKIDFFEMFVQASAISLEAAETLKVIFHDEIFDKESFRHIKELEHRGDHHMHKSLQIIESAFITPIDQSDIMDVLEGIENITDSIDDIANHLYIMRVDKRDDFMLRFMELIVSSCEKTYDLMVAFKQFKKNPNNNINNLVVEINTLEEEGDRVYSESMRHLFGDRTEILNIIKKKEIYQLLENTLNCCEDVADLVERIMLTE